MAEVVGSISVVATINTKGYDDGKQRIEKGNADLESNAKKTSGGFATAWTGAIAGVAASISNKLISAVGSLTDDMTDMYDASIKFPKTLQSMGATSDFAAQSFAGMKKYADDTIYSLEDMTKTFGSLYGITGKDTPKLVTALGGVSALAGNSQQAMNSWSVQLTQMVSKPMVMWQDFRILLEQNPAAIAKIGEAMGKTSKQLVEDVNNGTLSSQDFLKALNDVGNDPSLQKMATDSDNFTNATGQLQAAVVSAGNEILTKFGPSMIGVMNKAADGVGKITDKVIAMIDWFEKGGTAVDIIKSLGAAIVVAGAAFVAYTKTVKIISAVTAAYTAVSSFLTLTMSLQAQGLGLARAAWMALNIVMKANPIGIIITLILALTAGLIWFFTQTETGKKIWQGFMDFMGVALKAIGGFFSSAWNFIVSIWNGAVGFFKGIWNGIVSVFNVVGGFFKNVFTKAWNNIVKVFSVVGGFFRGVWNTITGIFTNIGTAIGNAIGGAFKNVVNSILKFAVNTINGFIDSINGAIDLINKISGVDIGTIGRLPIPQLANGGIVTAPTLAMIGEGTEPEVVIPLSKLDKVLLNNGTNNNQIIINVSGVIASSPQDQRKFAEIIGKRLNEVLDSKGQQPIARGL